MEKTVREPNLHTKYRVLHEHLVAGAEDANDGGRWLVLRKQIIFEQFLVK